MEKNLFHKVGFEKTQNKKAKNNFICSTLQSLTNINFISNFILELDKEAKNDLFEEYKKLLEQIKNLPENNTLCPNDFEKYLFGLKEFNSNENCNPQFLLDYIITQLNLFLSSEFKNSFISDNLFIIIQKINKCMECEKYIEEEKTDKKYLNFDLTKYLKPEEKDAEDKQEINIYDCLKSYIKIDKEDEKYCKNCQRKTKHQTKKIFKKLPKVFMIFVEYGNDPNFELQKNITFDEELNFKDLDVEKNYKDKEYYLSSLICFRELMTNGEHFHTFCRGDEESKYFCYNNEKVYEVHGIKYKIEKKEIQINNKKERFPSVLIYTSK